MMNIVWSQAFQVGIEDIDASHADHLNGLKRISTLIPARENASLILAQVEHLLQSLRDHNLEEERRMADLQYPDLATHQAVHTFLFEELKGLANQFTHGNDATAMMHATSRMGHLLLDHIIRHDLPILTFIQGRGRANARMSLRSNQV